MSNFVFLQDEWPEVFATANRAEALATDDPRAACFYARRTLELLVHWLYKFDSNLRLPYQDIIDAQNRKLTNRGTFLVGPTVWGLVILLTGGFTGTLAYWLIHYSSMRYVSSKNDSACSTESIRLRRSATGWI